MDLDYIVEWVSPESPASTLDFWICPATLVFDPAWDLTADVDMRGWAFQYLRRAPVLSDGPWLAVEERARSV